jgi:hypothetical protein
MSQVGAETEILGTQNGTQNEGEKPTIYYSPMVFSVSILLFEWLVYNCVYLGRILPTINKVDFIPIFGVLFNTVWILTFWCFVSVHCTDPGSVTDQWRNWWRDTTGLEPVVSRQEWQPGKVTTNKRSPEIRPERAHFCSTLKKDVLRMDHYCPWTGNVVGLLNHKHFLLLGFYGALSGFVAFATALPDLIGCVSGYSEQSYVWANVSILDRSLFIAFGVFAVLVMLLLSGLVTSHFPLACRNMTTIEELYTNMPNPYDQQKWFLNLEQVFGGFGYDWFLPVRQRHPRSDGFSYRRNGEVLPAGLVEVYGRDARQHQDDIELLHRLPEDIWHYRYTGKDPREPRHGESGPSSWFASSFAWLAGG